MNLQKDEELFKKARYESSQCLVLAFGTTSCMGVKQKEGVITVF